jgi:methyl-accepting chemotaxis protein
VASASAAAASETNAGASETNAAASASAASTSAINAAASETNAAASETAAGASETAAAASEAAASTSETNAAASEAAAETARDGAVAVAPSLSASIGNVSAVLGQAYKEIERLSETQQGYAYTLNLVLELASLIGALSDQVNGGQASLRGGTLADPALRIGTVGIYSSAADTLSIAIAETEVARITASGITIYGTVTETP